MSEASQRGGKVEDGATSLNLTEATGEEFGVDQDPLETVSDDEELSESIQDCVDGAEVSVYVGTDPETSEFEMSGETVVLDSWEDEYPDPLSAAEVMSDGGLGDVVYVIEDCMAGTLARRDWQTERVPGKVLEENDREDAAEIVRSAFEIMDEWSSSITEMDELSGVVLLNDYHSNNLYNPPVKFDFDRRNDGGEDSIYRDLLGSFVHGLERNGWRVEYTDVDEGRAEVYLAP